jgi:hypothetical protein
MILEIPPFNPAALGLPDFDPVPDEPPLDLDCLVAHEPIDFFRGARSIAGPVVREQVASETRGVMIGPAALAALASPDLEAYLDQFRTLNGATWLEAWGHILVGDLYGSGAEEYVLIASFCPETTHWNLWFRMHDDFRVRTDRVLLAARPTH